jgi:class 3 adenylate cyclase
MFIDLRNFTGWSEQRTPEEVVAMLNRYYNIVETIAKQHNVIKLKFAGDEVMAIFPDAHRAMVTSIELRKELTRMLDEYGLGAGIGLNTGRLVEGLLGSREVKVYDVIGDTVNTAKRIENAASSTEVLISEATRLALGDGAVLGAARQIEAKGKEAPVVVYPLLAKNLEPSEQVPA